LRFWHIVFSLDSVITAVGLVEHVSSWRSPLPRGRGYVDGGKSIGDFVDEHPTIKILALSFLILVGVTLMVEGFDVHVPKGYIYFAMAFSVAVEMLNIRMRKIPAAPVKLHKRIRDTDGRGETRG
jgi:predicted tellurium resistance membrane protein TerC